MHRGGSTVAEAGGVINSIPVVANYSSNYTRLLAVELITIEQLRTDNDYA